MCKTINVEKLTDETQLHIEKACLALIRELQRRAMNKVYTETKIGQERFIEIALERERLINQTIISYHEFLKAGS